jgi:hypothetical protein
VKFSGKIVDNRKRDMLPSPAEGKEKSPRKATGGFKTSKAASKTKGI